MKGWYLLRTKKAKCLKCSGLLTWKSQMPHSTPLSTVTFPLRKWMKENLSRVFLIQNMQANEGTKVFITQQTHSLKAEFYYKQYKY